ncbi:DUF4825 domain-containing protein [Saccharibacillus sp. VR-M41]|uniref:DUF4825 domain-containing protein n=1 Tax=Saccharibacillus alkalitolerans TaxID=2705290 RepID=A0ABX0F911_9BACL|nr:DUF4825 domain-containing protein [Saccharibacillus alkalitolerans]
MTGLFLKIVNMSVTASYIAALVILVRLLLLKAPKAYSYALWLAVAVRLMLPVSFTSELSLLRLADTDAASAAGYIGTLPKFTAVEKVDLISVGTEKVGTLIRESNLPAAGMLDQLVRWQFQPAKAVWIWLFVAAALLLYSLISYIRLRIRIRTATKVRITGYGRVYESDRIDTPFVCGFLKPSIYLPSGMDPDQLPGILEHERKHISRGDHWIKPFAFLLLTLHWFNPLMWLSYRLMSRDMEMSCDESVLRKMGAGAKKRYASCLLSISEGKDSQLPGSPLFFGENDVKSRIKRVLAYRRPSARMPILFVPAIVLLIVGCTADPAPPSAVLQAQRTYLGYEVESLREGKTLYVGNFSKVGNLLGQLPQPAGLQWAGMRLETTDRPYGIIARYSLDDSAETGDTEERSEQAERVQAYRNSVLLLSLIDNVDRITYSLPDSDDPSGEQKLDLVVTREEAEKRLGQDVRRYAETEEGLKTLIDRLEKTEVDSF